MTTSVIKANSGSIGIMWLAGDGDLSPITLLDTSATNPTGGRVWDCFAYPDNLGSAPAVDSSTANPASFTPPAAGEWYVIRLTRTLVVSPLATEVFYLAICVPSADGTYAIPCPGLDATPAPGLALVNLNSQALALGWAGGVSAGLPGLSSAVRKALTSAVVPPASPTVAGTQSIDHYIRTAGQALNVKEAGATGDGSTNDYASLAAACSESGGVAYPVGNYKVATAGAIGTSASVHTFEPGAIIHAVDTTPLTLHGQPDAAPGQQIFAVNGPGAILMPDVTEVHAAWFGATGGDSGHDDGPGLAAALTLGLANGITVHVKQAATLWINSPIVIGAAGAGVSNESVTLRGGRPKYNTAQIKCGASLPKGQPMILWQNGIRFRMIDIEIDANGLADTCVLVRSDSILGSYPSWLTRFDCCVFRGARTKHVILGNYQFEPTVSGATFTAAGHPLQNDQQVYFATTLEADVPPTGFVLDAIYWVVNKAANTFQLSATMGGSAITASDTGLGRWYVCELAQGDMSSAQFEQCNFPSGSLAIEYVGLSSDESLGTIFNNCFFNGDINPSGIGTFTANPSTDVITPNGGLSVGDCIKLWRYSGLDVMPGGLTEDTEYYVLASNKLALAVGGSIVDITSAGTNTIGYFQYVKIVAPFHAVGQQEGDCTMIGCTSSGLHADVRQTARHFSAGAKLTLIGHNSQSWRILKATKQGIVMGSTLGSTALINCESGSITQGSRASVDWNQQTYGYATLSIIGGMYYNDILIAGVAPVQIQNPALMPYGNLGDFQANVRGDFSKIGGAWTEGFTAVTRTPLAGPIHPALGASTLALDASVDSSGSAPSGIGSVQLKAKTGTGSTAGVFLDSDEVHYRLSAGTDLAQITYPSSTGYALTASGFLTLTGSGAQLSGGAGAVTVHAYGVDAIQIPSAAEVDILGTTINLKDSSGNQQLAVTNIGSGQVVLTAPTEMNVVGGVFLTVGIAAQPNAIIVSAGAMDVGVSSYSLTLLGNALGFFGATPAAKQTITGALSSVIDANAKAVLTSILAALATNYGLVTNGTT